jgi:hypothetical protein
MYRELLTANFSKLSKCVSKVIVPPESLSVCECPEMRLTPAKCRQVGKYVFDISFYRSIYSQFSGNVNGRQDLIPIYLLL